MGNTNKNINDAWKLLEVEKLHPGFSVDCVVFSFHNKSLKVLLTKFKMGDFWSLPGGFMYNHENGEQAAKRVLNVRTGLKDIPLNQFYLFSDPLRTIIAQNQEFIKENDVDDKGESWLVRRFISLGFYSLVKYKKVKLPSVAGEVIEWFDINNLPSLYSDHNNIIETALRLMPSLKHIVLIASELLPSKFTMTELRTIYERFLCKEFDRRNFQRKILTEGFVVPLNETEKSNAYNPPLLYSFDKKKVKSLKSVF